MWPIKAAPDGLFPMRSSKHSFLKRQARLISRPVDDFERHPALEHFGFEIVLHNQVLASTSAIFTWASRQEILLHNPCRGVERHATVSRERVLSDAEVPLFWNAFSNAGALKTLLLLGQRPGEVNCNLPR
jgi:integrase